MIRANNEAYIAALVLSVRETAEGQDKDDGEQYLHLQLPFATAFIRIPVRSQLTNRLKLSLYNVNVSLYL